MSLLGLLSSSPLGCSNPISPGPWDRLFPGRLTRPVPGRPKPNTQGAPRRARSTVSSPGRRLALTTVVSGGYSERPAAWTEDGGFSAEAEGRARRRWGASSPPPHRGGRFHERLLEGRTGGKAEVGEAVGRFCCLRAAGGGPLPGGAKAPDRASRVERVRMQVPSPFGKPVRDGLASWRTSRDGRAFHFIRGGRGVPKGDRLSNGDIVRPP